MRLFPPIVVALLASACAPTTPPPVSQPAPAGDEAYRAVGTEPGWALTIDDEMRYEGEYGATRITVPTPEPRTTFNGHRYVTARLIVDITHSPCSDGMSDRHYPDTVMVTADGKTVHGCGGAADAGAIALAGTSWMIATIDGTPAATAKVATLRFTDDRVSGNAGCNSFGGSYALDGDMLIVGRLILTKMACLGPGMDQERAVFGILGEPMRITRDDDGSLTLSDQAGTMTLTPRE